jgi:predicted DsbA family dithiol-disulfide isomerase
VNNKRVRSEINLLVEIWFDYSCPFCYIGRRKFEAALEQFEHKKEVEIVLHSFELIPDFNPQVGESIYESISKLARMSTSQARQAYMQITGIAEKAGLDYRFEKTIPANTFNAHRLTHYAAIYGKAFELSERIFKAYFTDGLNISDYKTLALLAGQVGLDETNLLTILESHQYADDVHEEEKNGHLAGVQGVPHFLFNKTYTVSGAQEVSVYKEALNKAWAKVEAVSVKMSKVQPDFNNNALGYDY